MGCIETPLGYIYYIALYRLNSNMGCIETGDMSLGVFIKMLLNSNMGCIETTTLNELVGSGAC